MVALKSLLAQLLSLSRWLSSAAFLGLHSFVVQQLIVNNSIKTGPLPQFCLSCLLPQNTPDGPNLFLFEPKNGSKNFQNEKCSEKNKLNESGTKKCSTKNKIKKIEIEIKICRFTIRSGTYLNESLSTHGYYYGEKTPQYCIV